MGNLVKSVWWPLCVCGHQPYDHVVKDKRVAYGLTTMTNRAGCTICNCGW